MEFCKYFNTKIYKTNQKTKNSITLKMPTELVEEYINNVKYKKI